MEIDEIPAGLTEFRQAAVDVKSKMKTRPNNDELLLLYGLFKQAIHGDNTTVQPSMFDMKARAKWNAWSSHKGMSKTEAQEKYIAHANALIKKYA